MNFISPLQYSLLPPFFTKEMEVICLVDLPGRRLKHNLNLGQPASRSACCPLPGHSSQEVISGHQMGKEGVRPSEGARLPHTTAFNFPNTLIRFLPRALCSVRQAKGNRVSVQVLCSGLDSNQRSRLSASLCVPGAPPFSPSPLPQVLRLPATFRCDILNISKGYSH